MIKVGLSSGNFAKISSMVLYFAIVSDDDDDAGDDDDVLNDDKAWWVKDGVNASTVKEALMAESKRVVKMVIFMIFCEWLVNIIYIALLIVIVTAIVIDKFYEAMNMLYEL